MQSKGEQMKVGVVAACLMLSVVQARADSMIWHIQNNTTHHLQVQFDSQTRAYFWPTQNTAWNLNKKKLGTYSIACNAGEYICYAAWSNPGNKVSWGKGSTGKNACTNCCYTCGPNPNTQVVTLHD
jgi:hypothetical protein